MRDGTYRARGDTRFTPSARDVDLYRLLLTSTKPMSRREIVAALNAPISTVDHSLRWWLQNGLLKKSFYDKQAWYRWGPGPECASLVTALSEAAQIDKHVPLRPSAAVRGLRALARLLGAIADRLEKE